MIHSIFRENGSESDMNGKIYKIAVIGGGASGLAAAIMLGEAFGEGVIILEKTNRAGKKLVVTGNGRGNVTNRRISADNYHSLESDAAFFVRRSLSVFGGAETEKFLSGLGVLLTEENGRMYPSSFQASSVLDLMRLKLSDLGVEIRTEFEVKDIKRGGVMTLISAGGETVFAEKVILAAGGKCRKEFGTDGSGYSLAEKFGHTVTDLYPSLVQLKTDLGGIKNLKGIRQDVLLTLYSKNMPITCERGDVLFTDFGVSGNAVFQISGFLIGKKEPELSVEFLPDISGYELAAALSKKINSAPYLAAEDLLTGFVNKQVGRAIVARAGFDLSEKCRKSHINAVIDVLKDFRLRVLGTLGFSCAQVTRGGIRLSEIEPSSMRSKKADNLYIAGEVMDIDGDCGGYNLQWAFTTAYVIACDIARCYGKEIKI